MRRWFVPVLAALGLADAGYLSVTHLQGELPACGGYAGCGQVNSSPYAEIFGIPVALLGAALYLSLLVVSLWRLRAPAHLLPVATLAIYAMVLAGTVVMAYLTALEFFVLHAYCYWCLGLATITLLLLILVVNEVWRLGSAAPAHPATRRS
jgi:uncharacterized membrane protein